MNEQSKLSTSDLYFAAYLKAKSCQIIDVEKDGAKITFVFDISDSKLTIEELKHGYFNNDHDEKYSVVAIAFADAIRALKTLCHLDNDNDKIVTPDLYFASYLKTKKCSIESIQHKNSKTIFVFNPSSSNLSILELKLGYFNNISDKKCIVNASDYTDATRSLKTMCHITSD
jgi:hypothetical protein